MRAAESATTSSQNKRTPTPTARSSKASARATWRSSTNMKKSLRSTRASGSKSSPRAGAKSSAGFTCRLVGRRFPREKNSNHNEHRDHRGEPAGPVSQSRLSFHFGRRRLGLIAALQAELVDPILQRPITHREHFRRLGDHPVVALERLQNCVALERLEIEALARNLVPVAPLTLTAAPRFLARQNFLRQIARRHRVPFAEQDRAFDRR